MRSTISPRALGTAVALLIGICVTGLLLPWRHGWDEPDTWPRDGFTKPTGVVALDVFFLTALAVATAIYVARPTDLRHRWLCAGGGGLAAITLLVTLLGLGTGSDGTNGRYLSWPGPTVFLSGAAATAALCWFAGTREPDDEHPPSGARAGPRWAGIGVGLTGILLAAGALSGPWRTLTSAALTPLQGAPSTSWTGLEADGHAARVWILAAGTVLTLAALAWARSRRVLAPALLAATGAVTLALSAGEVFAGHVRGISATIGPGIGAWVVSLGALLAVAGGGAVLVIDLGGVRPGAAHPSLAAMLVALVALAPWVVVVPPSGHASAAVIHGRTVFAGNLRSSSARLGTDTVNADVSSFRGLGREVVLDDRGSVWFANSAGKDTVLIEQDVDGRALPALTVEGARRFELLAVTHDRVLLAASGRSSVIAWVDARAGSVNLDDYRSPADSDATTRVVLAADRSPKAGPGTIPAAQFHAAATATGSVLITAHTPEYQWRFYRVTAAQAARSTPWRAQRLTAEIPRNRPNVLLAPDGSEYRYTGTAIFRVSGAHHPVAVLGNVSDQRCTLSRDPLSVHIAGGAIVSPAFDRAGDLWFVLGSRDYGGQLYVITTDRMLRKLDVEHASYLRPAHGGGMLVDSDDGTPRAPTTLLADASAAARAAKPLGPVPSDCVSDNRVHPESAHHTVTALRTLRDGTAGAHPAAVTAADGTLVRVSAHDAHRLVLDRPGHAPRTVYRTAASITQVHADGRGGAWWLQEGAASGDAVPYSIGHLDGSGRARLLAPRVMRGSPDSDVAMAVDAATGDVWWQPPQGSQPWWRMDRTGHRVHSSHFWPPDPLVAHGRALTATGKGTVARVTPTGEGSTILGGGRGLMIPSAFASHAPARDYSTDGALALDAYGRLLLHQGRYLIRVRGPQDVQLLAGPQDGMPDQGFGETMTVVGGQLLIRTAGDRIYRVGLG